MTNLVLPPHVQRRIDLERRAERRAAVFRNCTIEDPRCQEWTRKLQKERGPDWFMVLANETVETKAGLLPGYFHILVRNENTGVDVVPLHNGGAFVEPGSWIFAHLNRGDLRERRVRERLAEREREEWAANERELVTANENRKERLKDIVDSATKVRVSMNRDTPWSQNVAGRRGAK